MSLTDDARLVVDSELGPHKFNHIATVSADSWKAAVRLATAYIEAGRVDGGGCPRCGCELLETLITSRRFACGVVDHGPQHDGRRYVTEATSGCMRNQIARLTAKLETAQNELSRLTIELDRKVDECGDTACAASAERERRQRVENDLADHQQRLMRQSAELNAVRQERDDLKQRIAAAPMAWAVVDEKTERVIGVCNHEYDAVTMDAKTTQSHVVQVRLLEVRGGE